jgi:HD domain
MSRRVRERPLVWAGFGLSVVGAIVLLIGGTSREQLTVAAAFGVLIFVGELARVTLPGDRQTSPIALAAALGYALLFAMGNKAVWPSVLLVAAVQGVAVAGAALLHRLAGRPSNIDVLGRQLLAVAAGAATFHALVARVSLGLHPAKSDWLVPIMVVSVVVAGAVDLLAAAADRALHLGTPLKPAVRDEAQAVLGLGAATAATGVLIALSSNLMGWYALPVLILPLLTTQFSFRRYAQIRSTYRQTIRALSKITEVGGYVQDGHSIRVSALAVSTGREVGMTEGELLDLEYAALMHDIGQLSLAEPIPRGSTLTVPPAERKRIAALGAEIIRSSGTLDRVAVIVERQSDPYRRNRRPADDTLPIASRIIKAASAYDDLVSVAPGDARCRADALERLRLGMAYEYDPRVVEALARVVSRTASSGVPVAALPPSAWPRPV